MKLLLTMGLLFTLCSKNSLLAQSTTGTDFRDVKGSSFLNAGIGLGSFGLYGTGGLPLTASFEHGITKNISAGVNLGFIQKKYYNSWKYTYLIFGVRGSYHFNEILNVNNPKLDLYGGAGLLYRHYSVKYTTAGYENDPDDTLKSSGGDISIDLHAGGRYLFNARLGAFAEVGYGISPLQAGISLTF